MFQNLSPEKFQSLCCDLLRYEYGPNATEYLPIRGHRQDGIDSYVFEADGKLVCLQAKHEKDFGQTQLKTAIKKFENGKFFSTTKKFILAHTSQITKKKLSNFEEEIFNQKKELIGKGVELIIWNISRLTELIKFHPSVLSKYPQLTIIPDSRNISFKSVQEFKNQGRPYLKAFDKNKYLNRIVSDDITGKATFNDQFLISHGEAPKSLDFLFQLKLKLSQHKVIRNVLLSFAGMGKSFELIRITHELMDDDSIQLVPVLLELSGFHHDSIDEFLDRQISNFWRYVPPESLLLLLDAYDEVPISEKEDFDKKLEEFANSKHQCHIIVSCRKNVYEYLFNGFDTVYWSSRVCDQGLSV